MVIDPLLAARALPLRTPGLETEQWKSKEMRSPNIFFGGCTGSYYNPARGRCSLYIHLIGHVKSHKAPSIKALSAIRVLMAL
jgi:hypothetical protein